MNSSTFTDIEKRIAELSLGEQLWLIERLAHRLRKNTPAEQAALESDLAAMAADQEVQRELQTINEEFSATESNGLDSL